MPTPHDPPRGVCISVERTGDEVELRFELVQRTPDHLWQPRHAIAFQIFTVDEIDGKMTEERFARFGALVLDLLYPLVRRDD